MSDRDIIQLHRMIEKLNERYATEHEALSRVIERVAKLEALVTTPKVPPTSGQLASAGEATVPPGGLAAQIAASLRSGTFRGASPKDEEGANPPPIAPGHHWEGNYLVRDEPPAEQPTCECVDEEAGWCADIRSGHHDPRKAPQDDFGYDPSGERCECRCHEPAEQPSRQETGGGETACTDMDCFSCTPACRDRAKAKTAEQAKKEELADSFVEHMRPLMVSEAGRTLMTQAAEPSGNPGQLPGVDWASMDKRAAEVRQWPAWKQKGTGLLPEPSGTGQLPGAPVGFPMDQIEGLPTPVRPSEPPAPAVGTLNERLMAAATAHVVPADLRHWAREVADLEARLR